VTKNAAEKFAVELKALAERLDRCEQVARYDTATEKQAWALAHSLLDLAESFRTFLDDQLPRLRDERVSCDELHDILFEIGEEFRHILYHVREPEFYAYLRENVSGESSTGDKP
jgi:hypothetical protein